jgi:hypothetical protein
LLLINSNTFAKTDDEVGGYIPCRIWIPQFEATHKEPTSMPDIMVVFACLSQSLEPMALRQLKHVIEAILSISGRVTMRGLSRWSGKGRSYRTLGS